MKTYNGSVDIKNQEDWDKNWKDKLEGVTKITGAVRADNAGEIALPGKYGNKPKPIHAAFAKHGYLFADNILSKIISKNKMGKIVVYKTKKIGNRDKIIYVVQKGDIFSHGEKVKQAVHDLRYKLSDRDTTKYAKWTLESVHPIADIIGAYRAITGACETGTKQFCEGKDIPERMSVKAAIEKTKGAYKAEQFEAFFEDK